MILSVTNARHIQNYQVWLQFNDGKEGVIDLVDELWGTMFEPLKNLSLFSQVKLDNELDTIVWPNGADLAPEFLYSLLTQTQGNNHA